MPGVCLSVILPVYKVAEYLPRTLDSLLKNDLTGAEILAVNDGSPDDSGAILSEYLPRFDGRLRVFEKENGGLSDARNYGLERARGEYVAFLDSDDAVSPGFYDRLLKKARETGADVVLSATQYLTPGETKKEPFLLPETEALIDDPRALRALYCRLYPAAWNKLYRRALFEESGVLFKPGVWFEDVEMIHRLFPFVKSVAGDRNAVLYYTQRPGSITAAVTPKILDYLGNMDSVRLFLDEKGFLPAWENELAFVSARYLFATMLSRAARLDKKEYRRAVKEALTYMNERFPAWRKNPYFYKSGVKGLYLKGFCPALGALLRWLV